MEAPVTPPAPGQPAAAGPAPRRAAPWRVAALLLALLAATGAAYLPAVDGEFVFDDDPELMGPMVRAPFDHGLGEWLASPRPLTTFTFALNDLAVGGDTRGWHLTSVAIHLAAVLLAWAVGRRLLLRAGLASPDGPALAAAALFALHPLQVESVAYLSQRAEALAAGWALLGLLLLLLRDEAASPGRRLGLLAGAAAAQAAGLLSKPTAAVLPATWLLAAALLPPPGEAHRPALARIRARLLPAAPLLLLSLAAAARGLRTASGSGHAGLEVEGLPPLAYLATQCRVLPRYLGLTLWPAGLSADWDVARSAGLGEGPVLAGLALLAALAGGAGWLAWRARGQEGDGPASARLAAFGFLAFLAALAPSSSVIPLADVMAEHRVYPGLPWLALAAAAAAAAALRRLAGARARAAGWALALAACAALGGLTAARAAAWSSAEALWRDTVRTSPGKARVHVNLGYALLASGRLEEALAAFDRAAALRADRTVPEDLLLTNVVDTLAALGRLDEARARVEAALAADPASRAALGLLVRVEFGARRFDEAEAAAGRALSADPENPLALKFLGMLLARRGDLPAARALLGRAAAAQPGDPAIHLELGRVAEALGDPATACEAYRRAAEGSGPPALTARAAAHLRAAGCGGG